MSSFELNKIAGAILAALMLAMVSGVIANMVVSPKPLAQPAYMVAAAAPSAEAPAQAAGAAPPQAAGKAAAPPQQAKAEDQGGADAIAPLLAGASVDAGKTQARKCTACHTFEKGAANRIGPNLYGVVGEPIAEGRNGYAFSAALAAHKGEKWTIDDLNLWLTKPQSFAQGTKMTFAGFPSAKDRADVIAYLNSLSDDPKPLTATK